MAYIPVNLDVFNAAYAGAISGRLALRVPLSATAGDYATDCNVSFAIAQELDTLWPAGTIAGTLQLLLVQSLVEAMYTSRQPLSLTPGDYAQVCNAIIAMVTESNAVNPVSASIQSALSFRARNVSNANQTIAAFNTTAACDGVTPVQGDCVLLVGQTAPQENGPWIVGVVTATIAPLKRPGWWPAGGTMKSGVQILVGGEGTDFRNTTWKAMVAADSFVIDTTSPAIFPVQMTGRTALAGGTFTRAGVLTPIFSTKSSIQLTRTIANTAAATIQYATTIGGGDGITPGAVATGAFTVQACVAAGTINNADVSTLDWVLSNQMS